MENRPVQAVALASSDGAQQKGHEKDAKGWAGGTVCRLMRALGCVDAGACEGAAWSCRKEEIPRQTISTEFVVGPQSPRTSVHSTCSKSEQALNTRAFIPERVNAQIADRYKMNKQEIGSGGYGRVYVAQDCYVPGRRVAIKKVNVVRRTRKIAFQREAEVMKELDHPNICKLLETYDEGKSMFLVMEYCDGGELFEHIVAASGKGLGEVVCAEIVRQIAGALRYAHNRGIAHRDLKPENICLCGDTGSLHKQKEWRGHVKVIDWGLSAFFGSEGRMRSNVGSVAYAAPEVFEPLAANGYTATCDLWSLGVLTYVSLSGRFPFAGNNSYEQLQNMRACRYSLHGTSWSKTSAEAKAFIKSLLRKDPACRPTAEGALRHAWLRRSADQQSLDHSAARAVFANLQRACTVNSFAVVLAAIVARQLDHRSLRELPQVFLDLDLDGSGVLDLQEVKQGFQAIFGEHSLEMLQIDRTFALLDLDGSGTLDYTEFCAAALGDRLSLDEQGLKAAFKAFDIHDDNGFITRNELQEVLTNANVNEGAVAVDEVFKEFDKDADGTLNFEEWRAWVQRLLTESRSL